MENKDKILKRLHVHIPIEIHNQIKHIAIFRNCSVRKLVIRALLAYIKYEEKSK